MSSQNPQLCKDVDSSKWMYNDQDLTPCQILDSSIRQFEPSFNLTWLDLSFACPRGSNQTNTTTYLSRQLSDFCCSSVSFSLFSSCWACQWDQPVQGYVRTTWDSYSSTCSSINTTTPTPTSTSINNTSAILAAARIGTLSAAVQSALTAANIHLPPWLFLPVRSNETWDETSAKSNVTASLASSSAQEVSHPSLSPGAIAGISIGSFIFFCILVFAFTVFCMRKKQRHRLEAFRHRSASMLFSSHHSKKRVVNMREKGIGGGGRHNSNALARMDLVHEDDADALASPVSAKGGVVVGARRVNSDLTMDISREAMLPALLANQGRRSGGNELLGAPASGVAGVPTRNSPKPRTSSGEGMAARLQNNVRKSLARLGRFSQPGRTSPLAAVVADASSAPAASSPNNNNTRHTHPFSVDETANFAVPFTSTDQPTRPGLHSTQSAPATAMLDTRTAHPLTQQQLHPQLARNVSHAHTHSNSPPLGNEKPVPMPLTKEALALARVAQDGTLFVLGEPDVKRGSGKTRGAPGPAQQQRSPYPQQQQQQQQPKESPYLVRTVSIERNPAQMQRHVEMVPRRSDSLRRSEMHPAPASGGQGQTALVLHESLMDGTVPRRKTPSRQRGLGELDAPASSSSNPNPNANQQGSSSRPQASSSSRPIIAPVARKPVPKSDSSAKANAGSAVETEDMGEDDESLAALEIRHITGSATGTSGSGSGTGGNGGNGNGHSKTSGARGKGKQRGWGSDDVRLSIAANTSLSSGVYGILSDGTRTPSPKVAPSAEWFEIIKRGEVPTWGTWTGGDAAKAELTRNKTVPMSNTAIAGSSKPDAGLKRPGFQPSAAAGPSMPAYERNRTQSSTAAEQQQSSFYRTPIAALYSSTSSLNALASGGSATETGTIRKQLSATDLLDTTGPSTKPAFANPQPVSRPVADLVQPPSATTTRALPSISTLPVTRQLPTIGATQPIAPLSTQSNQMAFVPLAASQALSPVSQGQPRPQPSIPLPNPPAAQPVLQPLAPVTTTTNAGQRVAPAGARPVRRLPQIPPQSPTS
ncbi:hypothetical protein M408DRAFT_24875 [Serendipita vermifera MAFF 305830]|uniref:Uncharacterized protein n=1 Tax=Serendipita vermifera MAFF 305830 TaxID=933852 RepID=A0A0C3B6S0_SERVB|nr:hypothetical protein M408DRAFT_24875 [Serendipita vermifera MAFF 305830]